MRHVPVEYRMTLSTLGFIEVELRCCMVINVNFPHQEWITDKATQAGTRNHLEHPFLFAVEVYHNQLVFFILLPNFDNRPSNNHQDGQGNENLGTSMLDTRTKIAGFVQEHADERSE